MRDEIRQFSARTAPDLRFRALSWQQLAAKNRVESKILNYTEKYFSHRELGLAARIINEAVRRTKGDDNRDQDYQQQQRYSTSRQQR